MKKFYLSLVLLFVGAIAFAQNGNVSGTVITEDGEPSIAAIVRLTETSFGAITDYNGDFMITDVPAGTYELTVSSVGFDDYSQTVAINSNETTSLGSVTLAGGSLALEGIEIIADIAIDRKTPVAVSNIDGDYLAERLGNQEIGEALTVTPSVYATKQGGGAGDSRIVVRGFDQRNTVYMVNGVPVNDMENGWVYWSNWAGLADVASKIQVQRGLGATMLANPSVGGTVNMITKTTDMEKGGHAYGSIGNDMYRKYGLTLSTGNINDWAITFSGTRTTGDGYVGGTFNDAYSWFGSISKDFNNHSLVLTGLGAPQRHGQRTYAQKLTSYVPNSGTNYSDFISDENAGDHDARGERESIRWNSSYGMSNNASILGAREDNYINERTNFYHKPQVALNHYWDISDNFFLGTTIYGSWGRGGGTGPYGEIETYKSKYRTGDSADLIDWDKVREANEQFNGRAPKYREDFYLLRASMNEHDWYGGLTKGIFTVSDNVDISAGLDYRTYTGTHYRKVVDLFGLSGYNETGFADYPNGVIVGEDDNVFGSIDNQKDKIAYDNDGKVDWLGGFTEVEYSTDQLTLVAAGSLSNKSYERIDRRNYAEGDPNRTSDKYDFNGYAVKGGASFNINDNNNLFVNAGMLSVAPVFDVVFPNFNNVDVNEDPNNEQTTSFEAGYKFRTRNFGANLNGYITNWKDKTFRRSFREGANRERRVAYLTDAEAIHKGIELDAAYEPTDKLEFTFMGAINDWQWDSDVDASIYDDNNQLVRTDKAYISDIKVGDAPQTQAAIGTNFTPFTGLRFNATYRYFADYYAGFDVLDRTQESTVGVQAVELPEYGLLDLGAGYSFPLADNNALYIRGNLYNVLDELYVSDAIDRVGGDLSDLRGYFGQGRTWTTSVGVRFGESKKKANEVDVVIPVVVEPVVLDTDGDGVIDAADKCPTVPGSLNGCPDTDGDGVIDSKDDCPTVAGLDNGCPVEVEKPEVIVETETVEVEVEVIPDADGDGVIDSKDKCPNVAGSIYNGGCPKQVVTTPAPPVVQQPTVQVIEQLNFIARSILFNFDSAVIKQESTDELDEIASIINQYPNTEFVLEGHTDSLGDANYNKQLSQKRANAVKTYLVKKGVSTSKITSIGYGEEMPIADNSTPEGRKQNRRVVIKLK